MFDNVDRQGVPPLIHPYHSHPEAPASGSLATRALTGLYTHARQHGRWIGGNFGPWNGRNPAELEALRWDERADYRPIYNLEVADLPDRITNITAICYFMVGIANATGVAPSPVSHHRIQITNGSFTDVSEAVRLPHPPIPWVTSPRNSVSTGFGTRRVPFAGTIDPVNPFSNVYSAGVTVTLDNLRDGDALRAGPHQITVESYASNDTGTAISYAPVAVSVFWEVRG